MDASGGTFVFAARDSARLQRFLDEQLPYSLPLLRRLQYYDNSSEAVAISTFDVHTSIVPEDFAIGFFDPLASAITCGVFSSLDVPRQDPVTNESMLVVQACLRSLFARIRQYSVDSAMNLNLLFAGSVNSASRGALRQGLRPGAIRDDLHGPGGPYDKYTFQRSTASARVDLTLPEGFLYDDVRPEDYQLVLDNNNLARRQDLPGRPSVCIREESTGLPIACRCSRTTARSANNKNRRLRGS